ncbi:hypothetical protein H0H87_004709, partial [Tephrocybe sp. NHM501043]
LKLEIAQYCSAATLSSLALVERGFQAHAERELYTSIAVTSESFTGVFKTLALNIKKGELIRFLTVEACRMQPSENHLLAKALLSILPTLVSLKDLRVRFLADLETSLIKELSTTISGAQFHLHTLFCNDALDITQIVKDQYHLQFLGLYRGWGGSLPTIQLLKVLQADSVPLPIVFTLEREGWNAGTHNCIELFPAFLPPGAARNLFQALKPVFDRDRGSEMTLTCDHICSAFIFFDDIGDTTYVV